MREILWYLLCWSLFLYHGNYPVSGRHSSHCFSLITYTPSVRKRMSRWHFYENPLHVYPTQPVVLYPSRCTTPCRSPPRRCAAPLHDAPPLSSPAPPLPPPRQCPLSPRAGVLSLARVAGTLFLSHLPPHQKWEFFPSGSPICGGDYQDGAMELVLPVACPELLLPVACPGLLLPVVRRGAHILQPRLPVHLRRAHPTPPPQGPTTPAAGG